MYPRMVKQFKNYKETKSRIKSVRFTTLAEYLHILKEITTILRPFGSKAMLYLAAAVSDFYIPAASMVCLTMIKLS